MMLKWWRGWSHPREQWMNSGVESADRLQQSEWRHMPTWSWQSVNKCTYPQMKVTRWNRRLTCHAWPLLSQNSACPWRIWSPGTCTGPPGTAALGASVRCWGADRSSSVNTGGRIMCLHVSHRRLVIALQYPGMVQLGVAINLAAGWSLGAMCDDTPSLYRGGGIKDLRLSTQNSPLAWEHRPKDDLWRKTQGGLLEELGGVKGEDQWTPVTWHVPQTRCVLCRKVALRLVRRRLDDILKV